MSHKKRILLAAGVFIESSLAISDVSGITIVYNEHPAVPVEAVHNYIAGRGKNTIEEVIVDERVLRAAFFFFSRKISAPQCSKEADEGGTPMWRWHGNPVWRQGDTGWK